MLKSSEIITFNIQIPSFLQKHVGALSKEKPDRKIQISFLPWNSRNVSITPNNLVQSGESQPSVFKMRRNRILNTNRFHCIKSTLQTENSVYSIFGCIPNIRFGQILESSAIDKIDNCQKYILCQANVCQYFCHLIDFVVKNSKWEKFASIDNTFNYRMNLTRLWLSWSFCILYKSYIG